MISTRSAVFAAPILLAWVGCGGAPPPAAEPKQPEGPAVDHHAAGGPSVESEIGAMSEEKVKRAFEHASPKLSACFNQGVERVPFLAGDVRFVLRIKKDGSARWAFVKDSNLGDRATEECMLNALKAAPWPQPQGGEGLAENTFSFTPGEEERPPIDWSPERLGAPFRKVKGTLAKCRAEAGGGPLKATMYVDTDGKATAIGVSSDDERGASATDCVVSALKAAKFPSPGSYAAKVTIAIE